MYASAESETLDATAEPLGAGAPGVASVGAAARLAGADDTDESGPDGAALEAATLLAGPEEPPGDGAVLLWWLVHATAVAATNSTDAIEVNERRVVDTRI